MILVLRYTDSQLGTVVITDVAKIETIGLRGRTEKVQAVKHNGDIEGEITLEQCTSIELLPEDRG